VIRVRYERFSSGSLESLLWRIKMYSVEKKKRNETKKMVISLLPRT